MKKLTFLMVSLLVAACGRGLDSHEAQIDDVFRPYLDRFIAEGNARGLDTLGWETITIEFREDIGATEIAAICSKPPGLSGRSVRVRAAYWNSAADEQREAVIDHELGHCLLDRAHRTDEGRGGAGCSIMHPGLRIAGFFTKFRTQFFDELFFNDGSCPSK